MYARIRQVLGCRFDLNFIGFDKLRTELAYQSNGHMKGIVESLLPNARRLEEPRWHLWKQLCAVGLTK